MSVKFKFPLVEGYRKKLPEDRLEAKFSKDSDLSLISKIVGPSNTRVEGLIGEGIDVKLVNEGVMRNSTFGLSLGKLLYREKVAVMQMEGPRIIFSAR